MASLLAKILWEYLHRAKSEHYGGWSNFTIDILAIKHRQQACHEPAHCHETRSKPHAALQIFPSNNTVQCLALFKELGMNNARWLEINQHCLTLGPWCLRRLYDTDVFSSLFWYLLWPTDDRNWNNIHRCTVTILKNIPDEVIQMFGTVKTQTHYVYCCKKRILLW